MLATLRYVFATVTVLVAVIFAISPFAGTFVEQWSRHDVELRSTLVFNSMRDDLATFRRKNSRPRALVPMAVWPGNCEGERVRA